MNFNWVIHSITLLFVLSLLLFQRQAFLFSQSILGKLIAILLILGYTTMDRLYGLILCLLIVIYYQEIGESSMEGFDHYSQNMVNVDATPTMSPIYVTPVESISAQNTSPFREKYCYMGKLKYKGYDISKENAPLVFPEIKFSDNGSCNPCEPTCKYSISEVVESERMILPKSSKDWTPISDIQHSLENVVHGVSTMFANVYTTYTN
jgi:hypothetical protein